MMFNMFPHYDRNSSISFHNVFYFFSHVFHFYPWFPPWFSLVFPYFHVYVPFSPWFCWEQLVISWVPWKVPGGPAPVLPPGGPRRGAADDGAQGLRGALQRQVIWEAAGLEVSQYWKMIISLIIRIDGGTPFFGAISIEKYKILV